MRNHGWFVLTALLALPAAAEDLAGRGDPPLVPRYPGAEICAQETEDYGDYALVVAPATSRDEIPTDTLEGRLTRTTYVVRDDSSTLEVMRNYELALGKAGFQPIWSCKEDGCAEGAAYKAKYFSTANPNLRFVCNVGAQETFRYQGADNQRYLASKLSRPGEGDLYAAVVVSKWATRGGGGPAMVFVQADVVEMTPMDVGMELKLADEMQQEISGGGRSVLYGILFDHDSDSIKPQSASALQEIEKLLDAAPDLEPLVVGHTDHQGNLDYNLDLSRRRARAVVNALVSRHGIARSRLEGHGVGFLAPVASNDNEQGRAKNRRVGLVRR